MSLKEKRHFFLFLIFWNVSYYFWTITPMKNVNDSKQRFNLRVLLSICLQWTKSVYYVETKIYETTLFYKQLGSGLSLQSCLYFHDFRDSSLMVA